MRFTRCDACGAKALMAASQCPKCSHWLGLRDDRGETVPLARCRTCQGYYPRKQGGCKWCGAEQPASRPSGLVWGGLSIVLIAGVAWGATRALGDSSAAGELVALAPPRMTAIVSSAAAPSVTPPDPASRPMPSPPIPSQVMPPSSATAALVPAGVQAAVVGTAPAAEAETRPISRPAVASATETRPAPPDAQYPADTVRPMPGDAGTARTWVNVRAGTSRAAEVLGVVTPDARVRFGEMRGAWIQIKTADLTGWADRRLFVVVR